jgi:hypothetical protein
MADTALTGRRTTEILGIPDPDALAFTDRPSDTT